MLGRSADYAATIGDVASKLNFKQYTLRTSIKMQQQKHPVNKKKTPNKSTSDVLV